MDERTDGRANWDIYVLNILRQTSFNARFLESVNSAVMVYNKIGLSMDSKDLTT